MTVSIGFDHRHDLHIRAQQPSEFTHIVPYIFEIDLGPGRPLVGKSAHINTPIVA